MAEQTNVEKFGRIVYVEPNNFSNGIPNGIPQPYEDMCISVDLLVMVPRRDSCGQKDYRTYNFSTDSGTISFMNGTNGMLTTNYTDINLNNPENNTQECLGIESITVQYESWFYPRVNIKFVDVRGASLMLQGEYLYENKDKATGNNPRSFFNALFSFPYPLFKLKVKGFYGKEVTYNLAVSDVKANFNADNGNFEVNTTFIGYMYGVYTDVPMPFIAAAPYIRFNNDGNNYWEKQTHLSPMDDRAFVYNGSKAPILTFPELFKKLADFSQNTEKFTALQEGYSETVKTKNELEALRFIETRYDAIKAKFTDYEASDDTHSIGTIFCPKAEKDDNKIIINQYIANKTKKQNGIDIYDLRVDLIKTIRAYNDSDYGNKLPEPKWLTTEGTYEFKHIAETTSTSAETGGQAYLCLIEGENSDSSAKTSTIFNTNFSSIANTNADIRNKYIGGLSALTKNDEKYLNYILLYDSFEDGGFGTALSKRIEEASQKVDEVEDELKKLQNLALINLLGFTPTIENVYKMGFAHFDAFTDAYFTTLDEIKRKIDSGDRNLKTLLGESVNTELTDLPTKAENLMPFTLFTKKNDGQNGKDTAANTEVLPGDFNEKLNDIDEMKLVRAIIAAVDRYAEEVAKTENNINADNVDFVPITLNDIQNFGFTPNPYAYLQKISISEGDAFRNAVLQTFAQRYFDCRTGIFDDGIKGNKERRERKGAELFGKIEAFNLLSVNKDRSLDLSLLSQKDGKYTENYIKSYLTSKGEGNLGMFIKKDKDHLSFCKYKINDGKSIFFPNGVYSDKELSIDWSERTVTTDSAKTINESAITSDGKWIELEQQGTCSSLVNLAPQGTIEKSLDAIKKQYAEKDIKWIAEKDSVYSKTGENIETEGRFKNQKALSEINEINIFTHPFYYLQNSKDRSDDEKNKAKAYLFLLGLSENGGTNSWMRMWNGNGAHKKLHLLKFGSWLWRNKVMTMGAADPIVNEKGDLKYNETTPPTKEQIYTSAPSYESTIACEVSKGGKAWLVMPEFLRKETNNFSETLKDKLIAYFEEWATTTFPKVYVRNLELRIEDNSGSTREIKGNEFFNVMNNITSLSSDSAVTTLDKYKTASGRKITDIYDTRNLFSVASYGDQTLKSLDWKAFREGGIVVMIDTNHIDPEVSKEQTTLLNNNLDVIDNNIARTNSIETSDLMTAFNAFKKELETLNKSRETQTEQERRDEKESEKTRQLSVYETLRHLYNKWFCAGTRERWMLGKKNSEFNQFVYLDAYHNNIGDKLLVSLEEVKNSLTSSVANSNIQGAGGNQIAATDFYNFLSLVCQKNGLTLLALPQGNALKDPEGIREMFDAIPYSKMDDTDTSSYVCIYPGRPSQHLNTDDEFADDEIDLCGGKNDHFTGLASSPEVLSDSGKPGENSQKIPAFGVSFAKQNQSYFKGVSVGMDNPKETEFSMKATLDIATKAATGPREAPLYGQNLFEVYSNYSYTCSVDMMGDAQIMPMMYFQLNNIPMFKGVYQIINVEHTIVPEDMTTKFTGVRISKNNLPLVDDTVMFIGYDYLRDSGLNYEQYLEELEKRGATDLAEDGEITITLKDLTTSSTAREKNIGNWPDEGTIDNMKEMCNNLLVTVFKAWNNYCDKMGWTKGVNITSGYRSPKLNEQIGSKGQDGHEHKASKTSAHRCGFAVDTKPVQSDKIYEYQKFMIQYFYDNRNNLPFDQIIEEHNDGKSWIHIGYKNCTGQQRKEFLLYKDGHYYPHPNINNTN